MKMTSDTKTITASDKQTIDASYDAALACVAALESKKGEDIRVIDISEVSTLADCFVIASGSNRSQIQVMSDEVERYLAKEGIYARQVEGYERANWILLDFGDIIVHIFDKEQREYYDLERLWRDGKRVDARK